MPFYARVNDAISRANYALNQLYSYNDYSAPSAEPNRSIRNNARLTIDPLTSSIRQGVYEGRYEGVSGSDARQALRAADLLSNATWSLSDRPDEGRPADVPQAQYQIRQAIDLLQRARW